MPSFMPSVVAGLLLSPAALASIPTYTNPAVGKVLSGAPPSEEPVPRSEEFAHADKWWQTPIRSFNKAFNGASKDNDASVVVEDASTPFWARLLCSTSFGGPSVATHEDWHAFRQRYGRSAAPAGSHSNERVDENDVIEQAKVRPDGTHVVVRWPTGGAFTGLNHAAKRAQRRTIDMLSEAAGGDDDTDEARMRLYERLSLTKTEAIDVLQIVLAKPWAPFTTCGAAALERLSLAPPRGLPLSLRFKLHHPKAASVIRGGAWQRRGGWKSMKEDVHQEHVDNWKALFQPPVQLARYMLDWLVENATPYPGVAAVVDSVDTRTSSPSHTHTATSSLPALPSASMVHHPTTPAPTSTSSYATETLPSTAESALPITPKKAALEAPSADRVAIDGTSVSSPSSSSSKALRPAAFHLKDEENEVEVEGLKPGNEIDEVTAAALLLLARPWRIFTETRQWIPFTFTIGPKHHKGSSPHSSPLSLRGGAIPFHGHGNHSKLSPSSSSSSSSSEALRGPNKTQQAAAELAADTAETVADTVKAVGDPINAAASTVKAGRDWLLDNPMPYGPDVQYVEKNTMNRSYEENEVITEREAVEVVKPAATAILAACEDDPPRIDANVPVNLTRVWTEHEEEVLARAAEGKKGERWQSEAARKTASAVLLVLGKPWSTVTIPAKAVGRTVSSSVLPKISSLRARVPRQTSRLLLRRGD